MSGDLKKLSFHRPPHLTVVVLIVVAAAITLANLPSAPVSGDLIKNMANSPQRAYGWPLTWYWRAASPGPSEIKLADSSAARLVLRWPVARYSASRLVADIAIWLLVLAGTAAVARRLLGKYRICWRPRATTFVVLVAIAAPLVLANMTFAVDFSPLTWAPGATLKVLFGWPLIWNWYVVAPFDNVYGWDFDAARLGGNIAIWLATLSLGALVWEWLSYRYRPRLRFSLRTMLATVAIFCVLCAWAVTVRKRADEQDVLAESTWQTNVGVERWGPKWLGLVVPDRFRRCVVYAGVHVGRPLGVEDEEQDANDDDGVPQAAEGEMDDADFDDYEGGTPEDQDRCEEELLQRLGRLSALRSLDIECGMLTPAMVDALANLRQLRMLGLQIMRVDWRVGPADIAWLGKLNQLEHLSMYGVRSDEMACLTSLTRLKSLSLDLTDCFYDQPERDRRLAVVGKLTSLERLSLHGCPGMEMARLASLPGLKSLALEFDGFPSGLERMHQSFAAIGNMTRLERLHLAGPRNQAGARGPLWVHADDLAFLRGLTNLQSLTLDISCEESESRACLAALGRLRQLQRLWLEGDVVGGGLAELAPLASLEELTSDHRMATPKAIESLARLKRLRAVHIAGLDQDLVKSSAKSADLRRALESLRRSRPGLVVDGDYNRLWLEDQKEDFPSLRGELFDDRFQDLKFVLGFVPMGP